MDQFVGHDLSHLGGFVRLSFRGLNTDVSQQILIARELGMVRLNIVYQVMAYLRDYGIGIPILG